MLETVLSAALTCAAALVLGQAALRLCGWRAWSWLAAPVGISLVMLLAAPALHVPGRATTMGVVIAVLAVAAAILVLRDRRSRPPLAGLLAGLPVFALTLVPFAVAGRSGTLGVSFDNDMATHLLYAEAHLSEAVMRLNSVGPDYPLGPHAATAAIAGPTGFDVDLVFAGFTIAIPVLLGWTALAAVRRAGPVGQAVVALLVGMVYLVAAYTGEGSFKESLMAVLTLGSAIALARLGGEGLLRWVPFGLIVAGMIAVYSGTAVLWPVAFVVVGALVAAILLHRRGGTAAVVAAVRAEVVPLLVGAAVALVFLAPQIPRAVRFVRSTGGGTGLQQGSLGNLVGRLPFWEGLGIWPSGDFRMPPADAVTAGGFGGIVLALALAGVLWWTRRRDWMVPAAALTTFAIWVWVDRTQAPYAAAKALVMMSPFVMLVAVRPLVDRDADDIGLPLRWRMAGWAAALLLVVGATGSSLDAMRHSDVGPRDHMLQLRDLRASTDGGDILFLGNDDFLRWELPDVRVHAGVLGLADVPMRPEKRYAYGSAIDIDSFPAEYVNRWPWVISPRDAVGSAMPSQLHLVRTTRDFGLYRRVGRVPERRLLDEGPDPGKILDCRTNRADRALSRRSGVAAIRQPPVGVAGPALGPGADRPVELPLGPGTWDVVLQYTSGLAATVSAPGMRTARLPANLDRPGPRYPVGRVRMAKPGTLRLRVQVDHHRMSSTAAPLLVTLVAANPVGPERLVPLRRACGHVVDYWLPR